MAIESAFQLLQNRLEMLRDELSELRVNAEEFYPPASDRDRKNGHKTPPAPPPVVALADKATDLEGEVQEALKAARKAVQVVRHPRNLAAAQVAAGTIQVSLGGVLRRFLKEMAGHDALETLLQMGRELGDGWPNWAQLITSVIAGCRDRMLEALEALGECWQELTDKLAGNSVSVHSTNIGQQITARENMASSVQEFT